MPESSISMAEIEQPIASETAESPTATARPQFGAIDLLLVLMCLVWGFNFTIVKTSLQDFSPLSFTALRFVIASSTLMLVVRMRGERRVVEGKDFRALVLLGIMGHMIYQVAFIEGLARTRAGNAALILATSPVVIALLSAARGHERLTARSYCGVALSFIGMLVIVGSNARALGFRGSLLGDGLLLGSTVCWAVYTVDLKRFLVRYGTLETMSVALLAGTVPLVFISLPSLLNQSWGTIRPFAWFGLFYSALGAIVLSFFIWNHGIKRIGSTRTAAYSNLTPVIALFVAWVFLSERPTTGQLAGATIILLGIYLTQGRND